MKQAEETFDLLADEIEDAVTEEDRTMWCRWNEDLGLFEAWLGGTRVRAPTEMAAYAKLELALRRLDALNEVTRAR